MALQQPDLPHGSLTIAELKPAEQNILEQLSVLEIRCENVGCSATLPLFNITKHVKEDCEHKPVHLLLSAGEGTAAEKYGDIFGLYISEGTQAFKQLHDVNTTVPFKLYKDRKGNWVEMEMQFICEMLIKRLRLSPSMAG